MTTCGGAGAGEVGGVEWRLGELRWKENGLFKKSRSDDSGRELSELRGDSKGVGAWLDCDSDRGVNRPFNRGWVFQASLSGVRSARCGWCKNAGRK
jgi:hypothetical protein